MLCVKSRKHKAGSLVNGVAWGTGSHSDTWYHWAGRTCGKDSTLQRGPPCKWTFGEREPRLTICCSNPNVYAVPSSGNQQWLLKWTNKWIISPIPWLKGKTCSRILFVSSFSLWPAGTGFRVSVNMDAQLRGSFHEWEQLILSTLPGQTSSFQIEVFQFIS